MSNASKPAWPDPGAFPFGLFGAAAPGSSGTAAGFAQPIAQGLSNGVDLMKKMLGQMPGASAIPGFLLPTVDVEELDKRIADLRAAESWLDVNLNLLRATIQGLEVQRNTIAAITTFGAMGASMPPSPPAPPAPRTPEPAAMSSLPPGWPAPTPPVVAAPPSVAEVEAPVAPIETPAPRPPRAKKTAPKVGAKAEPASPTDALASMAANNWLGYMQDQFSKVAKAALSTSSPLSGASSSDEASSSSGAGTAVGKARRPAPRKRRKAAPKA